MKINRQQFLESLEAVRPALASKEIVEQSTSFIFKAGRVYTFNDQIAISHAIPAKELEGAVRSEELLKLLKRMSDDDVDVEIGEAELRIKGKRAKAAITLQAEITIPLGEIEGKKTWTNLPAGFAEAIKFSLFSAGSDMTKPELACVHIDGKTIETCDNFRLTRYTLEGKAVKDFNLLIPASACADLVKFDPTHYDASENWVHFTNKAGAEFSCRTVSGKFPDLQPFLDRPAKHTVEFPADIAEVLNRAVVFLSDDRGALRYVNIDISRSSMIVHAKGEGGWFEEKLRMKYGGDPIEFMINPQFLLDILPIVKQVTIDEDCSVIKFEGEKFVHCASVIVPEKK